MAETIYSDPQAVGSQASELRSRAARQPWFLAAMDRLRDLSQLSPDWDSYGADPISAGALNAVRQFLEAIAREEEVTGSSGLGEVLKPFAIAPLASGGLQLEWRGPSGVLEVEAETSGEATGLLIQGKEPSRRFIDLGLLNEEWLIGSTRVLIQPAMTPGG